MTLLSLESVGGARLPAVYEAARVALAQCVALDECQGWADKSAALASYARQARDRELLALARRIQTRAIDRYGALLREIPSAQGHRSDLELDDADNTKLTRERAAAEAGLSERQRITALRVNAVPRAAFEELVEGELPPTISALARVGIRVRTGPSEELLAGRDPGDFEQASRLLGVFAWVSDRRKLIDLATAVRGLARISHTEDRDRALACVMTDRARVAGIGHEARGRFCC